MSSPYFIANRVKNIKPSATLAITAKANELKNKGINIIPMGSGQPDFNTPINIQNAGIEAIRGGQTKYTAVAGMPELKEAICNKFLRDNNLKYSIDEVMVSSGGKQVFYNLCQAILNKGDEVIIPSPYWVSYPEMVKLADATPVMCETKIENNFKMTASELEAKITKNTKLLVITSPSNPTGMVYTKKELKSLAKVLLKYPDIMILTDDIYEHIIWDEPFYNIIMVCPELRDRSIILNGVSKAYAMTGWRIGYVAANKDLISTMVKIQGQSTSNACSVSQVAAIEALNGDQAIIKEMLEIFKKRYKFIYKGLNSVTGIECAASNGAFYCFPKIQGIIDKLELKNDLEFASYCLDNLRIAIVPGSAFGANGYARFSFATSMENLELTIDRLLKI